MLHHDSKNIQYREPFGAQICGRNVNIKISQNDTINRKVKLLGFFKDRRFEYDMHFDGMFHYIDIQMPEEPGLYHYRFLEDIDGEITHYGSCCTPRTKLIQTDEFGCCFQITVYKDTKTPSWMRDGIMYQIFVDRFYKGTKDILNPRDNVLLHTSWNDKPLYARDESYAILEWDFFGGNLPGVIKKLDYIKSIGADIVYLNPIFDSVSNHKYDASDYSKVDPMFGDDEIFAKLIAEATRRDMHVILDGVFSHTGSDSIYFNREGNCDSIGAYQSKQSPYYSWYNFTDYPDHYDCWWGVGTMPALNEMNKSFLDYLVTGENSVVRKWMRLGIMGWRLDVADELPDEFIAILKKVIKEENPDAMLLGEVWEDASNKKSYDKQREYFYGDELDSVSNYPFRDNMIAYLLGSIDSSTVVDNMYTLYENYPKAYFYSLMNMTGTHDTIRLFSLLGEAESPEGKNQMFLREYSLPDDRVKLAEKRLRLYYQIMMSHPGMPCIYYGDETGMQGYADPFNRGTYPWGDENTQLIEYISGLARIRKANPEFTLGDYKPEVIGINGYHSIRKYNESTIHVVLNREDSAQNYQLILSENAVEATDLLTGKRFEKSENSPINIELEAYSGAWLKEIYQNNE